MPIELVPLIGFIVAGCVVAYFGYMQKNNSPYKSNAGIMAAGILIAVAGLIFFAAIPILSPPQALGAGSGSGNGNGQEVPADLVVVQGTISSAPVQCGELYCFSLIVAVSPDFAQGSTVNVRTSASWVPESGDVEVRGVYSEGYLFADLSGVSPIEPPMQGDLQ